MQLLFLDAPPLKRKVQPTMTVLQFMFNSHADPCDSLTKKIPTVAAAFNLHPSPPPFLYDDVGS